MISSDALSRLKIIE